LKQAHILVFLSVFIKINSLKYNFILALFCQFALKCAVAKKHVFDSEGTVAGMGWKTYALCVGF